MVTSREVRLLAEDPGAGAVGDDARGHDDRRRAARAEPDTRRHRAGRGRWRHRPGALGVADPDLQLHPCGAVPRHAADEVAPPVAAEPDGIAAGMS